MEQPSLRPGDVVAIIDVGSNSARLLVARALGPLGFEVIDEERFDARLGERQEGGLLAAAAIERGLQALRVMTQIARAYAPAELVIVGTEALRRATNLGTFAAAARQQSGVEVQVLSGQEEAAASFLGVINATVRTDGAVLDLGGGSLELMRFSARRLVEETSCPLGAIYARERYAPSDPPSKSEIRALRRAVRQQVRDVAAVDTLIGTGGSVRSLARLVRLERHYPLRHLHGMEIGRRDVRRLARRLAAATSDERRHMTGVNPARAETLHVASIIVDEVMDALGAGSLVVSGQGLREGLVWQRLRPGDPMLPDVRAASVAGLALANGVDMSVAEPIAGLARSLLASLAAEFELAGDDADLLETAAYLASIGLHIDYYDRDRHAEYLVLSGDLHGFTHREVVLLAALVRWSTSGTPSLAAYRAVLLPGDMQRAAMLASLLGIAQAVYRRRPSPVRHVVAVPTPQTLELSLEADEPIDAELAALERQQKRFSGVFGRELVVRVTGAGA